MRTLHTKFLGLSFAFHALNFCQFLITLNDAIARMFIIFFLNDLLGIEFMNRTLFLTSMVIVIPFLCFGMIGGQLADRYPKGKMIQRLQVLTISGTTIIWVSMWFKSSAGVFVGLFLMALQAALFSPARLAVIPELVEKEKIPFANSMITSVNYIALLTGAFIASYLTIATDRNFPVLGLILVAISVLAFTIARKIQSKKHFESKPIEWNFVKEVGVFLGNTFDIPHLFHVIIYGSYFLLACLFTQLNIMPFGYQELDLTDAETGYILLYTSCGLGIGAFLYGLVSRKNIEVSYALLGGLGTAISYFGFTIFPNNYTVVSIIGFFIGVSGGFFIVPLNGFIQTRSPEPIRASILAASNTVGFVFLLIGAGFLELSGEIFGFTAYQNFIFLAVATLIMWFAFAYEFRYSLFRPLGVLFMNIFYKVEGDLNRAEAYRLSAHNVFATLGLMVLFEPLRIIWDRPASPLWKRLILMFCSIQEIDIKTEKEKFEEVKRQMKVEGEFL